MHAVRISISSYPILANLVRSNIYKIVKHTLKTLKILQDLL